MKSKIKYIRVILTLIFIPYLVYGQENKSQELNILLNDGKYFESKELYKDISNSINPDIELLYKFKMSQFLNKDDSAAIYMEKMLTNYPRMFGNTTIHAYSILFEIYAINLRDYENSVYTYERMVQHIKENPYNLDDKEIFLWENGNETRFNYLSQLKTQPQIKTKRKSIKNFVKIESNERLLIETKTNGITRKSLIDTGCNYHFLMNRKEAKNLGLKCDLSDMSKGIMNNTEMLIKEIIVDSIEIGNITIYNVPTTIFEHNITAFIPDSLENRDEELVKIDSIYTNISNSIIGLPVMKMIGKFLIDYEDQTVSFPIIDSRQDTLNEPNMYIFESYLHTRLNLNGNDIIGTLDTGFDDYIKIDSLFYEKNKKSMSTTLIADMEPYYIMMAHKLWNNVPYKIVNNPVIKFNNNQMFPPVKNSVRIYPLSTIWYGMFFDGVIGYDFLKRIGKKVLLDLDNMRLEAID